MVEPAGALVCGAAMTLPDLQATLARIDFVEACRPEHPERSLYLREIQPVTLLRSGQNVPAYRYLWRSPLPPRAVFRPSGRWLPTTRA